MSIADITFVSMPTRANSLMMPVSYILLAGYLDSHTDIKSSILDVKVPVYKRLTGGTLRGVESKILASIRRESPPHIGFSLFPGELNDFLALASKIKRVAPTTKIITGGVLPTLDPKSLLFSDSPVDLVVCGDGERPLENIIRGGGYGDVPGLCWRDNETIHMNEKSIFNKPMDYMPAYDKLDMDYYCQTWTSTLPPYYTRSVRVFSSIGCPYRCHFCANPRQKVKLKKLETLIEELAHLDRYYHVDSFFIEDECLAVNRKRALEFCEAYRNSGLNLPWGAQTRANLLKDEAFVVSLKDAGCVFLYFGVESGSNKVLERVCKGVTVEDNLYAFRICRKHGIKTLANMMFNMPGETESDIKLSKKFLDEAKPTHVSFSLTVPLIGTQIYRDYVNPPLSPGEYGIYADNRPFQKIVDKRFRMASHSLDLEWILFRFSFKYFLKTSFGLISFEKWYREGILRRMGYRALSKAFVIKVYIQLRTYFISVWGLVMKLPVLARMLFRIPR